MATVKENRNELRLNKQTAFGIHKATRVITIGVRDDIIVLTAKGYERGSEYVAVIPSLNVQSWGSESMTHAFMQVAEHARDWFASHGVNNGEKETKLSVRSMILIETEIID